MQHIAARLTGVTVLILTTLLLLSSCAGKVYEVVGDAMAPAYNAGQMITSIPVPTGTITRGDPVIYQLDNGDTHFKRIVGLPGDTVLLAHGIVFVNGASLDEPYLAADESATDVKIMELGEDEYFILGDNRTDSYDSRHHGPIPADHIMGRVKITFLNRLTSR